MKLDKVASVGSTRPRAAQLGVRTNGSACAVTTAAAGEFRCSRSASLGQISSVPGWSARVQAPRRHRARRPHAQSCWLRPPDQKVPGSDPASSAAALRLRMELVQNVGPNYRLERPVPTRDAVAGVSMLQVSPNLPTRRAAAELRR